MNDWDPQTHGIVVNINRRGWLAILGTSILVLLFLVIIVIDIFAIRASWNSYEIDAGAYVGTLILFISTAFTGWALFVMLNGMRQRGPAIVINSQGFYFYIPLRFAFVPCFRQSFVPWDEIEWIGSFRYGMYTWLSLCLKDPEHYWSRYGYGPYRKWRRDVGTRAHINLIIAFTFSLSAQQIIQQVEENYSVELLKYGVKVKPFAYARSFG